MIISHEKLLTILAKLLKAVLLLLYRHLTLVVEEQHPKHISGLLIVDFKQGLIEFVMDILPQHLVHYH